MWSNTGNKYFMAPEQFKDECYEIGVDIWSCGVLLFTLLTGKLPF
jgi:serine/threonine protein kinase